MRLVRWALIAAILAAIAYVGYLKLSPDEEKRVRKRLAELAEAVTFRPETGNLHRGLMVERIPGFFTEDCEIFVSVRGLGSRTFRGREDVAAVSKNIFGWRGSLEVRFLDMIVAVDEEGRSAVVDLTSTMKVSPNDSFSAQEFRMELVKRDGAWMVRRAETRESVAR